MKPWRALILFFVLSLTGIARALEPSEILDDPALEERARAIGKMIRCVVCQNESIDESNAALARDMRRVIRDRLLDGESDEQIFSFLNERYGSFIFLLPPLRRETLFLWGGPLLLLIGAGATSLFYFRRKRIPFKPSSSFSEEEEERLKHLLDKESSR